MDVNPFYALGGLLVLLALILGKNNKYAAFACVLVAVLSLFVGTWHA